MTIGLLNWFKPKPIPLREQAWRAFGMWQVERKGSAATYISVRTGIPRNKVWGILLEKGTI